MLKITFRYQEQRGQWEWHTKTCYVNSIRECVQMYDLKRADTKYEILSVEKYEV